MNNEDIYEEEQFDNEDNFDYDEFQYYLNDVLSCSIDIGLDESQNEDFLCGLTFNLEV